MAQGSEKTDKREAPAAGQFGDKRPEPRLFFRDDENRGIAAEWLRVSRFLDVLQKGRR